MQAIPVKTASISCERESSVPLYPNSLEDDPRTTPFGILFFFFFFLFVFYFHFIEI